MILVGMVIFEKKKLKNDDGVIFAGICTKQTCSSEEHDLCARDSSVAPQCFIFNGML